MNKNIFIVLFVLSAILGLVFFLLLIMGYFSDIDLTLGIIIFLIIFIPLIVGLIGFLGTSWVNIPNRSVEHQSPLTQNRKAFLKAQPFICDKCKKFTDTLREICETCGSHNSIREAKKLDFKQFINE